MSVDFTTEALQIKPLITDEIFTLYQGLDAANQKSFLNSLNEDELLNLKLRLEGSFELPDTEFADAYSSARRDYMTGGTYPTDPSGMPMYGQPIEGSQAQEFANEIFAGMREKDFDYSGLQNNKLRRGLSFMDTGGEKEAYLTKNIGPENVGWTMDNYGRYAIMPEFREQLGAPAGDMPLTIDNPDAFERGDIADLAGSAPEITATILASIAARNLGLMPAMLATGSAAGAAKGVEEGVETLAGLQQQTLGEVGKDIGKEAALGATAEIVGRGLLFGAKYAFSPGEMRIPTGEATRFLGLNFKTYTYAPRVDAASGPGVTETHTLVKELLELGAIPDVEKATGKKIIGKLSGMIEQIFGYNAHKNVVNVKFMEDKINKFLTEAGAEPFEPFMQNVLPKLSEEELGALIQLRVAKSKSAAETAVEGSLETLKQLINTETKILTKGVGERVDEPGGVLQEQIFNAFDSFKNSMSKLYSEADNLLGNKPIIPTNTMKAQAQEILAGLPKTADGEVVAGIQPTMVRMLEDITNLPSHIGSVQMATYRTAFGDLAFSDEMLVGIGARNFNLLKNATNEAFDAASNNGLKLYSYIDKNGNLVATPRKIPAKEMKNIKLGLTKLDEAKTAYAEGISLFDNRLLKALTTRDGIDPDRIISRVVQPNSPRQIKQFINATDDPDLAKSLLQASNWDSMLVNSTDIDGNLSVQGVLSQIKKLGTTFPALYGESAPVLKRSLEQLNNVQKFIPKGEATKIRKSLLNALESGNLGPYTKVVKNYADDVAKENEFLKKNFVKVLGQRSPEEIMPWLINKSTSQDLTQFIKYYEKADPQVIETFKQRFMMNLLDNVFETPRGSPVGISLNGKNLLTAIHEGEMVSRINALYGRETAQALERFAQQAEFLTTRTGTMAGAFAANAIALNPLAHVPQLIKLKVLGSILANPTTLKYLTTIIESPVKRDVGFAVLNLGTDIIAQIAAEDSTIDPDKLEKMKLELQNGVLGLTDELYDNYLDEENE